MNSSKKNSFTPFVSDEASEEDKLVQKFNEYSKAIATSLRDADGTLTVGILGGWGSGKTTLMNLLAKDLIDTADYKGVVFFESWRYEGHPAPTIPLLHEIVNAIVLDSLERDELERDEQGAEKIRRLVDVGTTLVQRILDATTLTLGNLEFQPGDIFKAIREGLDPSTNNHLSKLRTELAKNDTQHFRKALEELMGDKRWAILIDDLDRSGPGALKILDATKSLLNSKGLTFVVGVDPQPVKAWVRRIYKDLPGHAEEYLDKIINVPVYLPVHDASWRSSLEGTWNNLFDNLRDDSASDVEYPAPEQCSLRQLKRIVNQTIIAAKLTPRIEVRILFGLICLRELDREKFRQIQCNPSDTTIRVLAGDGYLKNFDLAGKSEDEAATFFSSVRSALLQMGSD